VVNEVYHFSAASRSSRIIVAAVATLLLTSCASTAPPCGRASDCHDGRLCHLGRCATRLAIADSPQRVVLAARESYLASDDPDADGRLDSERHAAIYLAFSAVPNGPIDAAYLTLPLRREADGPAGLVALSIGSITGPWTTSEAIRGGAPAAGPALTRLRLRANDGQLRLDVTELVRSSPEARAFGFVVRAESAAGADAFLLGTEASGSEPPTLSVYSR
jgi:hypothetical protein